MKKSEATSSTRWIHSAEEKEIKEENNGRGKI
jgi:hypothetical protein